MSTYAHLYEVALSDPRSVDEFDLWSVWADDESEAEDYARCQQRLFLGVPVAGEVIATRLADTNDR